MTQALCSTELKDDVVKCVVEMNNKKFNGDIYQIGGAAYRRLHKGQGSTASLLDKRILGHVINRDKMTLHTSKCKRAGKKLIKADIINPRKTGLKIGCSCMK